MKLLMTKGNSGVEVDQLANALVKALGADAESFPVLTRRGRPIDDDFDAAIRRWQAGVGVIADGIIGPRCEVLLGIIPPQGDKLVERPLDVGNVDKFGPSQGDATNCSTTRRRARKRLLCFALRADAGRLTAHPCVPETTTALSK